MSVEKEIEHQKIDNREIVDSLLADGSNPDAEYPIEHHLSCANFDNLEKAAVDAFKLGFEVSDAEELELDDGAIIFCFDATVDHELTVERLDKDTEALIRLADKHKIQYDGWGTYFIDEDGVVVGDEFDEDDEF
ncbi:ribonuclease E inhibitor RraB [Psychrobium sp. 1_MG-2023]|uniref:ribonuclease E inhibitor RraB n=1 Tax=Psychrobium sp. 1_MG-2023 TaxID=3062624 RepID=UPI000C32805B|nr:ribonuclease E inhibitor RraB [Psychrobium sp. 1_MG-2023]MDP2561206.1 ribonuclease E inhibitor RraB [Psychrobium sp. 1_MG-2023]PKF55289.1 ribonuclease E inhibitor RraB [Alteromonadales bacterium alter-6D02]